MYRLTLLKVVQSVLSAMEADNVNSIDDTIESVAIARVAEETYYEMMTQGDWPHLVKTSQLLSLSDNDRPNFLEIPETHQDIRSLFYNGKHLIHREPESFIKYTNERNLANENVVSISTNSGVELKIVTDQEPTYFTMLQDKYVVTDSYVLENETTLQGHNSAVTASVLPVWESTDSFTPDLTAQMVPTYLALVKRAAFIYFRREVSNKDERQALAGMGRLRRDVDKLYRKDKVRNYGRTTR